ncbi:MAG: 2,3-bisphosphoglycerate-independent phosphoglycerate mutase [Methanothrix sp.]|uniref:2,3-bisphosphoglycerate-independent phosphoglycerate mutase n=1 Tax=Methanothrix sp. TaxID=90426 RepID=UPI0032AEC4D5|nr:2,3-bisphosphoglycerate-independent phosphoglycerate mutase [Methanothrix sp.]
MRPVVLIIMDGYGLSEEKEGNAVAGAHKPNLDRLKSLYPHTSLGASGLDVGLPRGQMGNSEVGHLNLGAGRIVYQDYTRISLAIEQNRLRDVRQLVDAMVTARDSGRNLHLMGLLSDGGVHSHITHLFALLDMAKELGVERVYVHPILDGRDVPPRSAQIYVSQLEEKLARIGIGRIATISGRYYAMDRDKRWDRTEAAYRAMTEGVGIQAATAEEAVRMGYERGETDEFLKPTVIDPQGLVREGDSMIFFNFRPDRARQITRAFVQPDFREFKRMYLRPFFVCMTQYDESIDAPVAFPPEYLKETLGEVLSRAGLRQLRIAETEKYAHVTYFFNGGREEPFTGEDRILIPSPKIPTYDLKPEMSAPEVTSTVVERIRSGGYDVVIMNYANPDMVGHTGIYEAAVRAVEAVDRGVGTVVDEVLSRGGVALITSDHGNAEKMLEKSTGEPHTAHTTNRVPFILAGCDDVSGLRDDGILADVAPTMLELLGIEKPSSMSGRSLIKRVDQMD